jgi:hypothetical protein
MGGGLAVGLNRHVWRPETGTRVICMDPPGMGCVFGISGAGIRAPDLRPMVTLGLLITPVLVSCCVEVV